MPYISNAANGETLIRLHVQPKTSKNRIVGIHDGCLKIAVTAPPVDGKANKAVVKFLASFLGIPIRDVTVVSGAQSRKKQVVVNTLGASEIRRMLTSVLS